MEFQEEWKQLVQAAQATPNGGAGSSGDGARMTLASARTGQKAVDGSGSPDLKVAQAPWTSASGVAHALQADTGAATSRLSAAHEGITWGLDGFMTPAALSELRTSWEERLRSIKDECHRLEGALKAAGKEFGEVDAKVAQSFAHKRHHDGPRTGR